MRIPLLPRRGRSLAISAAAFALMAPLVGVSAANANGDASKDIGLPYHDITDPREAKRVDSVPVPSSFVPHPCPKYEDQEDLKCSTIDVPMDYDNPNGPKVTIEFAVRTTAAPEDLRGYIFLNPGGPGGSAIEHASWSSGLSEDVTQYYNVVGMQTRGVSSVSTAGCGGQTRTAPMPEKPARFIRTMADTSTVVHQFKRKANDCGRHSPENHHVSSAQTARDMDVLRRALGQDRMNFLGFSYGTHLGQVYAELFPDRVRAIVADGVIDSRAWVGADDPHTHPAYRFQPLVGSERAMRRLLEDCDAAGARCVLASQREGDPSAVQKYARILSTLKERDFEFDGTAAEWQDGKVVGRIEQRIVLSIGNFAQYSHMKLYSNNTGLIALLNEMALMWKGLIGSPADMHAVVQELNDRWAEQDAQHDDSADKKEKTRITQVAAITMCNDVNGPARMTDAVKQGLAARSTYPLFGALFNVTTTECARDTWFLPDHDAELGRFTKTPANGILFVGSHYDPITPSEQAKSAAARYRGAGLVLVNNYGHTSYGMGSKCAKDAINAYLLTGETIPGTTMHCNDAPALFPPAATVDERLSPGGESGGSSSHHTPPIPYADNMLAPIHRALS